MFLHPQAGHGFADELPRLFERVLSTQADYGTCVAEVVDALGHHTGWDRAIYSEIRRMPAFGEVIHVANSPTCRVPLDVREVPSVSIEALELLEQFGGLVEVVANQSNPAFDEPRFEKLKVAEREAQRFLRAHGIQRAVYAPKRLTPNFVQLLALHHCAEDRSMREEDAQALRLAHIVLAEITKRKRWRFAMPGRSIHHAEVMPLLADGWDSSRIASELGLPRETVDRVCDDILRELQVQFGLRNSRAAIVFLHAEMVKPL